MVVCMLQQYCVMSDVLKLEIESRLRLKVGTTNTSVVFRPCLLMPNPSTLQTCDWGLLLDYI